MTEEEKLAVIERRMRELPYSEITIKKVKGQIVDALVTEHIHWGLHDTNQEDGSLDRVAIIGVL